MIPQARLQQNIAAAILADIPEVAVALRVEFGGEEEVVVIALGVAVFAGVDVVGVAAGEDGRAAAQEVVEIGLADVGIEARVGGLGGDGVGEGFDELLVFDSFLCEVSGVGNALALVGDVLVAVDVPVEGVESQRFSGGEGGGVAEEGAGRFADGDLGGVLQVSEGLQKKVVGGAEGCVCAEDEGGINDEAPFPVFPRGGKGLVLPLSGGDARQGREGLFKETKRKMPGLNLLHFGGVAGGGIKTEEGQPAFEMEDLHPGFDGAPDVLQPAVVYTVGDQGGHPVEDFEFKGSVARVCEGHLTGEGGERLVGQGEVGDFGGQPEGGVFIGEGEFTHGDGHRR